MKEENISGPSELRESPQLRDDDSDDNGIIVIGKCFLFSTYRKIVTISL